MAEKRSSAGSSAINPILDQISQFNAGVVDNTLGLLDLGAQGVAGISNMITGRNDRPVMLGQRAKSAAAEVAQEELRVTPTSPEFKDFSQQVRGLSSGVERAAARINKSRQILSQILADQTSQEQPPTEKKGANS